MTTVQIDMVTITHGAARRATRRSQKLFSTALPSSPSA
jgi:hypothetical protein